MQAHGRSLARSEVMTQRDRLTADALGALTSQGRGTARYVRGASGSPAWIGVWADVHRRSKTLENDGVGF